MSGVMASECPVAPDDGGQQLRTVNSILQSCLLTIFACVWTSAHPNINGPRDSGWTCLKRKVVTMLCAVVAPEFALFWALSQRSSAKQIAEKYNKEFARTGDTRASLWGNVVGWFHPLPKATTRRGSGQPWTTTHGFFVQMGGFISYENEYPSEVLDFDRLAELLRKKYIDAPTVTERNLQDRSKGDTISKAVVVLQTAWFVFQCVARAEQRLPLSELEVLTLAFAVVNVAIYAVWWNKPQGVDTAICVPLKRAEKDTDDSSTPLMEEGQHELANLSHPEPANLPHPDYRDSGNDLPLISPHEEQPDEYTGEKHSWLRRMLRKDYQKHSSFVFLVFLLPYRIVISVARPLLKMGDADKFEKKDLRVPMFYATDPDDIRMILALFVVGTIFGAIHLLAWASEFPSPREHVLWRISAILLTGVPLFILSTFLTRKLGMDVVTNTIYMFHVCLIPLYIAARFVVIVVALLAICEPPPDVLRNVSWTSYIPHF